MFTNIVVVSLIPSFSDSAIESLVATSTEENPVALILALYGAGNAPLHKQSFLNSLKVALNNHCVIVITSQCLRGSVDLTVYATGQSLLSLGVIDGRDMSTEAVVCKLSYCMGKGLRGQHLKQAMESNLRGELTTRHDQSYAQSTAVIDQHRQLSTVLVDNQTNQPKINSKL